MLRDLYNLENDSFDLLVVGGGIHGACVARDASLRGLKVALIERNDFGAATSHNSLKLIHGGFRYLQHFDFPRIRQSVQERRYWLWAAPHLVRPLKFVMPLYGHSTRGPIPLWIAARLYDVLSLDRNQDLSDEQRLPSGGVISRTECQRLIPGVDSDGLSGAAYWYDGQMLDADRILLECVMEANRCGAVVANYVEAQRFLGEPEAVKGVRAVDRIGGAELEIRAKVTVNTCGPWVDKLLRQGLNLARVGTGLSKGMNLVTHRLTTNYAFGVRSRRASDALLGQERRMFFFTPWQDRTVIGTSHLPYQGDPDDCRFSKQDVADFLDEINAAYPIANLTLDDVEYCYGGLTPAEEDHTRRGEVARSRQTEVVDHQKLHGIEGLLSLVGVKWTTARLVAENIVNLSVNRLGYSSLPSKTLSTPLPEASTYHQRTGTMAHSYSPDDEALLSHCREIIREEMAIRLSDLVFRRFTSSHRAEMDEVTLNRCASIMAAELGWSETKTQAELEDVYRNYWWRCPSAESSIFEPPNLKPTSDTQTSV